MNNILVFEEGSKTIRQMPQNYCIAVGVPGVTREHCRWLLDFDIEADRKLVDRVVDALFEHKLRYGTGLELLAAATPNQEFEPIKTAKVLAKELELKNHEGYYEYIGLSMINGQPKQVLRLYKKLMPSERIEALEYIKNYMEPQHVEILELINISNE